MRYCRRCVLPDTRPNLVIGPDGVCGACRSHATKRAIDWRWRASAFKKVVASAKRRSKGYDCLIPVSGGKDSTWQVLKCLSLGLNPLCVTWKTPARTELGRRNLENLVSLGVDHVDYQVNPKTEARFMLAAFERFGSTAVPMHMAIHNIPLTLAARLSIPLVVWGENSAFEYGSKDDASHGFKLDARWVRSFGVTHGTTAADWVSRGLTRRALTPYFGPTGAELARADVRAVFLGYYFPWDPVETARVAKRHGFRADAGGPRTGLYDFADIDDDFISIHHWLKWYKFGFTRTWDNLSIEIRNGRLTRDQAVATLRKLGDETPRGDIRKFCAFAGISERRFYAVAERFRSRKVWKKAGGRWTIPGFLLPDRRWE